MLEERGRDPADRRNRRAVVQCGRLLPLELAERELAARRRRAEHPAFGGRIGGVAVVAGEVPEPEQDAAADRDARRRHGVGHGDRGRAALRVGLVLRPLVQRVLAGRNVDRARRDVRDLREQCEQQCGHLRIPAAIDTDRIPQLQQRHTPTTRPWIRTFSA
jgi:hypothetical protein